MSELQTQAAPVTRVRQTFALRDLGIAPENMRFDEAPDEDIPLLAATIRAAGLMQPLTVRPGRKKEKPAMALDGRRRLLALELLRAEGVVDEAYPVEVFVETEAGRQAAAIVLTNTAAPVHVADVIAAIGKMLKARLEISAIAGALGYGEVEVRRLAALAGLAPNALQALKAGKLTLRQAKLLARLGDADEQAQIAESVLQGYGFPEHRVNQAVDQGRATRADRRFCLVGDARYLAAGGRIESDLFGELPDVLLDPELLDAAWIARARDLAARLGRGDLVVHATTEPDPAWPDDLEPFGYDDEVRLDEAQVDALQQAQEAESAALETLLGVDPGQPEADEALVAYLAARLAAEQAHEPERPVTLVMLHPSRGRPLQLEAFAPALSGEAEVVGEDVVGEVGDDDGEDGVAAAPFRASPTPAARGHAPAVEVEGVNHALHEVRTDLATRVLIRAVADHPATALTALIAQLFAVEVLHQRARGEGASTIGAEVYGRPRARVIEALDGDVRRRLAERRTAWRESGLSVIAWVDGLEANVRMALLAELTALSLDLREERTTAVRGQARAQAAELAALCGAEANLHWTPDDVYLRAHSKPQLLSMLEKMGETIFTAKALKKEELVEVVAQAAVRKRWAPAHLSWRSEAVAPPEEGAGAPEGEGEASPLAA